MTAGLERRLAQLEHELGRLQDRESVRQLQFKYGYYMDKCLFGAIVDLFADDARLYFMGGLFKGREGARRLYGGASGLSGPVDGLLFEHLIVQDIVDVDAGRSRAFGRFRTFMQGGVHETSPNRLPNIPAAFWEGGVYENEYVRADGVWKIAVFNYRVTWQADYEDGWSKSPATPLMVSNYSRTFPDDPRGPDEIVEAPPRWPKQGIQPFHYPHPVTGKPVP